jgi:hypothetical protein
MTPLRDALGWNYENIYSLRCSKDSRLGHNCAYQGVINYHGVFPVCPY